MLKSFNIIDEIYTTIRSDSEYKIYGNHKVIMIIAVIDRQEFSYTHNVLVNQDTTSIDLFNQVKTNLTNLYENNYGYSIDYIPEFKVRV